MGEYIYEVVHTEPDMPVKCFSYISTRMLTVPAHWHDEVEMIRVEQGEMEIIYEENQITLEHGDWMLINSRDIHTTISREKSKIEVLQIPFIFLKKYIPEMENLKMISYPQSKNFKTSYCSKQIIADTGMILHKMTALCEQWMKGTVLEFHAYFFQLLSVLYRYYTQISTNSVTSQKEENRKRMILIMDFVNKNYKEKITLNDAAGLVSLNREYFCRLFNEQMGKTFMQYVNEIRFYHVCEELFGKETGIMTSLEEHGFTNYKIFMRMFHERYQGTPTQIRKYYKGGASILCHSPFPPHSIKFEPLHEAKSRIHQEFDERF